MRWYYVANDNQQKGPIKEEEFIKLFQDDTITRDTLVWNGKTVKDWCKISTIDGIEDELKNWKPGVGQLLTSADKALKKVTHANEQEQIDVHDVEEKPTCQEKIKGQQAQTSQAVQITEDKGPKIITPQKVEKVEDVSPTVEDETNKAEAPKAIIQTNADKAEEKYSQCAENPQSNVNDLDSRLPQKVEEVEELKEDIQVEKVDTKNKLQILAKEKEELENGAEALEETEPSVIEDKATVKNLEVKECAKLNAQEDSSGKTADDWDKLSQENISLQKKNAALTEEHRVYKDKMNSRIADLESQLSTAANKSKASKEDLQIQSESALGKAKLEKEQNILKEKIKALNVERKKFEEFKRDELARLKTSVQVAGETSKIGGHVERAEGNRSIFSRWRWTLLSVVGLISVMSYKMLTRATDSQPEQKQKQSTLYSTAGETGKKLSETITNKVTDTISSKIPAIPSIPNIPSVFKK